MSTLLPRLRRRDFITLLGGAAAWPLAARAQQDGRMRRIGVLIPGSESDPGYQSYVSTFKAGLLKFGWLEGRDLRIDVRFTAGDAQQSRAQAAELLSISPQVIFSFSAQSTRALQAQTQTVPIVFAGAGPLFDDPIVNNIARPQGNITGFTNIYVSMGGKFVELLKEAAPRVVRIGYVYNSDPNRDQLLPLIPSVEAAVQRLGVKALTVPFRNSADLERVIADFAAEPGGGLIMHPGAFPERELLLRLATKYRLPMIMEWKGYVAKGGLISYGVDYTELVQGAASYVDRILRGAKVSDLPVQYPNKFELAINLKAAKAIGLDIAPALLARADEVIE
jgi:putative ABC transport system substrate-binding protein